MNPFKINMQFPQISYKTQWKSPLGRTPAQMLRGQGAR